ncbi:uncharacterized protein LOC143186086 [Calliopsis andreniformis]|uniref:uncharacterized protein LOC143186086 n=1 Tax=Calliopsis andreniformis TaxID=337506 RepID=UPI003FCC4D0B
MTGITEKETICFIDVYRIREFLWNPSNLNYCNKMKKEDPWHEIAEKTNRSAGECKKKVQYLQAALRREKMKMKKKMWQREEKYPQEIIKYMRKVPFSVKICCYF